MLSKESLSFLDDLKANNHRDWFMANKKRYEAYKKEYLQLATEMLEQLKTLDPKLAPLEPKHCQFRINRDIRFSADKSPYKTHMGLWFSPGSKNHNRPGYYIHIERSGSFIAGGFYMPDADELRKVRKEIAFFHDDLEAIIADNEFKSIYGDLDRENALKTMPKGYEKEHPAIEFLKLKGFTATSAFPASDVLKKDFVEKTAAKLIVLKPLNDFIDRALEETED